MKTMTTPGNPTGQQAMRYGALRIGNFLLTIGIMFLSFALYGLGLFGGVEGPLNPARLGSSLAELGLTKRHLVALLMALAVFAAVWDHLFNAIYRKMGARLICAHKEEDQAAPCGAPARREVYTDRLLRQSKVRYICKNGHRSARSDFKPWRKGPLSRSVGLCSLVFITAIFLS